MWLFLLINVSYWGVQCRSDTKIESVVGLHTPTKDNMPLLQCTQHNCPVRVHWHVKVNYKEYWRVKITITNFNYRMNYTQWTLVAQHPNLNNITQVFSFAYKPLIPYTSISKSIHSHNTALCYMPCPTEIMRA